MPYGLHTSLRHRPAGGVLFRKKEPKCPAVSVAYRLTKPQKPKRKKLASKTRALFWGFSVIEAWCLSSIRRCSNSFSFLTAFGASSAGHRQGRSLRKSTSWVLANATWLCISGLSSGGKMKSVVSSLKCKTSISTQSLVALPGNQRFDCWRDGFAARLPFVISRGHSQRLLVLLATKER